MRMNHFLGAVLLVAGTTIGAGMLALPIMTAFVGFGLSLAIFFICWFFMLMTAYFFLDVNCSLKGEVNLISMVHKTIGNWGKVLAWVVYLLLLYSLIAAYIAASAPLFKTALHQMTGYHLPNWLASFVLPFVFGGFVYLGTLGVDLINRLLMFGLVISYVLLVGFLPEHVDGDLLMHFDIKTLLIPFPVVITSFGYHIIIPTLTTYMNHDRKQLRRVLFVGSLIPLFIYILWQVLILGIVPVEGRDSLAAAWTHGKTAIAPLVDIVNNRWIKMGAQFFAFFAIITSFLGVSLSLSDFLIDGLKIKKSWKGKLGALILTFLFPMIFVLTYPKGFILALEYAGAFVAILLILLPALMAWHLKKPKFYQTPRGKALLIIVMLFALFIVAVDVLEQSGFYKPLLSRYHV